MLLNLKLADQTMQRKTLIASFWSLMLCSVTLRSAIQRPVLYHLSRALPPNDYCRASFNGSLVCSSHPQWWSHDLNLGGAAVH
jgi:hypothetical protein